ncbi:MAG: M48 family metallopeptidase [Planctomycetota bacterium]|nr:M48 family metallopeptidase [Planctomycetota bacterium]
MAQNPDLQAGAPDAFARHPKETTRFYVCLAFSAVVYALAAAGLALLALRVPLALIPLVLVVAGIYLMVVIGEAFFAAHVRGNGLKVSGAQLPHVYASANHAAEVLGIPMPEVYVVQFGRVREAFVRLFVRSRICVLSSALVEDCGNGPELDMAVGAELARFKFHHIAWRFWVFPAMVLPIIYPAYRRATQYTADRCGSQVCGDWQAARRTLLILAAGGRQGRKVNPDVYAGQVAACGGFWMTLRHLLSGHPALSWRVSELLQTVPEMQNAAPVPQRSILATVLCLFVPGGVTQIRLAGGGLGGLLVIVVIVSMLVGIMMPAIYMAAQQAQQVATVANTHNLYLALRQYCDEHAGRLPPDSMALVREAGLSSNLLDTPDGRRILYLPEVVGVRTRMAGSSAPESMPHLDALPPDTLVFFVPPRGAERVLVVSADGVTSEVSQDKFKAMLRRSEEILFKAMPGRP